MTPSGARAGSSAGAEVSTGGAATGGAGARAAAGATSGGAGAAASGYGGSGPDAGRGGFGQAGGLAGSAGLGVGGAASGASGAGGSAGHGGGASGAGAQAGAGGSGSGYAPCPVTGACKIMPFGDSITEGYNVAGGYRAPLFQHAHADGHDITFVGSANDYSLPTVDGVPFPPNHEGHGGYTIDDEPSHNTKGISPFVSTSIPTYAPHIITLMIGTNDINGNIDVSTAPNRLGTLLDSIHAKSAGTLVVLAQMVPTGTDSTNQAVRTYNAAMPALVSARTSMGYHLLLVDMYSAFTAHSDYKTSLMGDNLHPNQAGYDLMGATWYTAIAAYLR